MRHLLVQLGADMPLANAALRNLQAVMLAKRAEARDRAIYHDVCEAIGLVSKATSAAARIADPSLRLRALTLLADFNRHHAAMIAAEIERLTPMQSLTLNPEEPAHVPPHDH